MDGSSRRQFLQTVGAVATASMTATAGCTDLLGGGGYYDADDVDYLPLVTHDGWPELNEDHPEFMELDEAVYLDIEAFSSVAESLPDPRYAGVESIWTHPEYVSELVWSKNILYSFRVGRLQPGADPTTHDGVFDSRDNATMVDGRYAKASALGTLVFGPDFVMRVPLAATEDTPDYYRREIEERAARALANRPTTFPTDSRANERFRQVAESIGKPTRVILKGTRHYMKNEPTWGAGFSIGEETTTMRSVQRYEQPQDPDEVLRERRNKYGYRYSTYSSLDASQHGKEVWIEGTTNTHMVDYLEPGAPRPKASFTSTTDGESNTLTVTHEDGWTVPAHRLRLRASEPRSKTLDTQFSDSFDDVEPGDSVTNQLSSDVTEVVLEWRKLGEGETAQWVGIEWFYLD